MFSQKTCTEIRMLEKIYEIFVEARIPYGVKVWGMYEAWKETYTINVRFYKKILGVPQ
jgi:hypothetical protein